MPYCISGIRFRAPILNRCFASRENRISGGPGKLAESSRWPVSWPRGEVDLQACARWLGNVRVSHVAGASESEHSATPELVLQSQKASDLTITDRSLSYSAGIVEADRFTLDLTESTGRTRRLPTTAGRSAAFTPAAARRD
jgi:hypothetical protein